MVIAIFLVFVLFVVGISFYLGNKTKTSSSYYAAGGQVPYGINGIAFAGDYLSAASFLGICGMIATVGYDGFLYSIGYLAGWIVALFVVAEPVKRLGKYTFTDALDSKFDSRGIKLAAAISTLVVSTCYLIPQMVGAGVLVEPLLGIPYHYGVVLVGVIVIMIVATAGMASTTIVQFLKGGLLVIVSLALVGAVLYRGLGVHPNQGGKVPFRPDERIPVAVSNGDFELGSGSYRFVEKIALPGTKREVLRLSGDRGETYWLLEGTGASASLRRLQSLVTSRDGKTFVNGRPKDGTAQFDQVGRLTSIAGEELEATGPLSPTGFLSILGDSKTKVETFKDVSLEDGSKNKVKIFVPSELSGNMLMRPGAKFSLQGTWLKKLDFVSLMLALFLGTAALPHILIRYYTVKDPAAARKSTIVAIASIGFFYVLTLFMGLGAMVNGVMNPADSNMAAPLLARSFGDVLFAIISAIAFATVLGTVSGLIVAASGAVAHDLVDRYAGRKMSDTEKIRIGKISAIAIGALAIVLGILFQGMNVTFLVGLAFAIAASANLPSLLLLLFWKKTTDKGITASIFVGVFASIALIALSPDMFKQYGLDPALAPLPLSNPGIITIPLSFLVLVLVSLATQPDAGRPRRAASAV